VDPEAITAELLRPDRSEGEGNRSEQDHPELVYLATSYSGFFSPFGACRLTVNAVYWCLLMEKQIDPRSSVDIVGDYEPLSSGFDYAKPKVVPRKPSFYK
jgi:hypothetical protein